MLHHVVFDMTVIGVRTVVLGSHSGALCPPTFSWGSVESSAVPRWV